MRRLYAFEDSARFARAIARAIGAQVMAARVHRFPDRETIVRIPAPASREAILVRSLNDPNRKLVETILAADALRRAGARRVTLIAPYLPYMRQDAVFHPGEPLSQRVIGIILGASFERVLTLEAHLHRIARLGDVIPGDARSLSAAPAIAAWIG
ncbi:MAG: ribose-phosphate pyrophosphokinase-like domain-containing protein, partial [Candidatus Binataceae bacterium]